jgi:hypothetical protein
MIGFDTKPKGRNPLLNQNKKVSPERHGQCREDTLSNLTYYELGKLNGPTFNKSIKSEISTMARREQRF